MEQMITKTNPKEKLVALLAGARYNDALSQAGKNALSMFDLPTTRQEEWKYTRTGRIAAEDWNVAQGQANVSDIDFSIPGLEAAAIVFVDGVFRKDLSATSWPEGIQVVSDQSYDTIENSPADFFEAYQLALQTARVQIIASGNAAETRQLHVVHIAASAHALCQPLIDIRAEKSASLHITESFLSKKENKSFTHRKITGHVSQNAHVTIDKIQCEEGEHFLMNTEQIRVDSDATFTINTLTVDGQWIRNTLHISLEGQNIEANLNGIYLPRDRQFIDNHTRVDHREPHCNSNELYKGMLNDQSNGVFNGKVFVHPDAQKTNAFQSNANILLSDEAQMNTKPELEIYADDVKCSHGSTTGQLDEQALFYLRARGVGEDNARKLLASAFISDVLNKVENNAVREYVINALKERELLFD